jgi:hypothetical protein
MANSLKASYVTDSEAHVRFFNSIAAHSELLRRNKVAAEHLSNAIPFLLEVDLERLIRLRQKEPESFLQYRKALATAIAEVNPASGSALSAKMAKDLYADVIQPELGRLDRRLREGRRNPIRAAARSALGWTAVLSFGFYTGLVPSELAAAAKALGLTKIAADLVNQASTALAAERDIRQESFYFLWRVRKLARGV